MRSLLDTMLSGKSFYIGDMLHAAAEKHPDTPITLDTPLSLAPEKGVELTVSALADLVSDLAAAFSAAGVRPTDRVAIFKTHNFDIALLACAVARIGAVPALLAPTLDGETVVTLLDRLGGPWLVTDRDTLEGPLRDHRVLKFARSVILSAGSAPSGASTLADHAGATAVAPVFLHPRQPALITHSSGTTGIPKLAVHCAEAYWHRLAPQRIVAWPIRRRETAALCITFAHSRFYQGLGMFLSYGNPLVIAADPDPRSIGPLLTKTRPGYLETHPNTFIDWEQMSDADGRPLASVRHFVATFDAMHPRTIQLLLSASEQPHPLFLQFYGQSETGPIAGRWYTRRSAKRADGRCVGIPFPGFISLRVVGPDGRPVRRGQTGYLEVRSRSRILTYLGEDDRYSRQVHDGWLRLGDVGYRTPAGLLYLLDREVDRIDLVASNLAVEDTLMSRLTELREVVVVAGENGEPVAVVCTQGDLPLDARRWAEANRDLPPLAAVCHLRFDDLPRTSTRKVQRPALVRMLSQGALESLDRTAPGGAVTA